MNYNVNVVLQMTYFLSGSTVSYSIMSSNANFLSAVVVIIAATVAASIVV